MEITKGVAMVKSNLPTGMVPILFVCKVSVLVIDTPFLMHNSQCTMHNEGVAVGDYLNNPQSGYHNCALCILHCAFICFGEGKCRKIADISPRGITLGFASS